MLRNVNWNEVRVNEGQQKCANVHANIEKDGRTLGAYCEQPHGWSLVPIQLILGLADTPGSAVAGGGGCRQWTRKAQEGSRNTFEPEDA